MMHRSNRLFRFLQGAALAGLAALVPATGLRAQTPPPVAPAAPVPKVEEIGSRQEENAKKFQEFKEGLTRLAARLEKSDRPEDKDTAKIIRSAIEAAQKSSVESQFQKLVMGLKAGNLGSGEFNKLEGDGKELAKMLDEIYRILMTDDEAERLRAEIIRLQAILANAKEIKKAQERLLDQTQSKVGQNKDIANSQERLQDRTEKLHESMGGTKKPGGTEKKDDRSAPKSEAKDGEKSGENKPETGEDKGGNKPEGEPKDSAEPKPGGKGGDPKEAFEPKPGSGEPKEGAGEAKGSGEPKDAPPMPPMAGEPKPGKPSDPKGEGKGKGEGKPSEAKAGGEGKGQGAGKPAGGEPKPGGSAKPGEGGSGGAKPPSKDTPGRKEVEESIPFQEQAKKKIEANDRDKGGKNQDQATERLAKAIEELEKRLKQLREEELKKLLANVEARVGKMLAMQVEVYNQTVAIDGVVQKNGGTKGPAEIQRSQQQGEKEQEIVFEADKTLKLLESEGSAVAFARVLEEVRQDMIAVQRRLAQANVSGDTQEIEKNIIDMLTEMKEALKKAQKEMDKPPPPSPPGQSKPPNKKLIDLLAELKLIRSMQVQVNKRTEMHGKKEAQTTDPLVQAELRQLSARQAKLQDMLEKLATGANQ